MGVKDATLVMVLTVLPVETALGVLLVAMAARVLPRPMKRI